MKYLQLYTLIFFIFISSCDDKPIEESSIYFGACTAFVNGELWNSDVRAKYSFSNQNYLLLSFDKFESNILRQELHFRFIELEEKSLKVLNSDIDVSCDTNCCTFSSGYDDQAGDSYNIIEDDSFEDWIVIDSIDDQTLEFWGRFQASFVRDFRIPKFDIYPDTLYFEGGEFNGKILD